MKKKTNIQDLKNLNTWSIFKFGENCWVWNQFSAVSDASAVSASSAVTVASVVSAFNTVSTANAVSAAKAVSAARTKLVLPEQS